MRERKPYPNISDEELDRRAEEALKRMIMKQDQKSQQGGHGGGQGHQGGGQGGQGGGGGNPGGGGQQRHRHRRKPRR